MHVEKKRAKLTKIIVLPWEINTWPDLTWPWPDLTWKIDFSMKTCSRSHRTQQKWMGSPMQTHLSIRGEPPGSESRGGGNPLICLFRTCSDMTWPWPDLTWKMQLFEGPKLIKNLILTYFAGVCFQGNFFLHFSGNWIGYARPEPRFVSLLLVFCKGRHFLEQRQTADKRIEIYLKIEVCNHQKL